MISIIPHTKNFIADESIISLCLMVWIATKTIILRLTIACNTITFFDDIKYRYNIIDKENNIAVATLDFVGKNTLPLLNFIKAKEKTNKTNDDMKNANSVYSIFKTNNINRAKNIDEVADRILAFMKFLSVIVNYMIL